MNAKTVVFGAIAFGLARRVIYRKLGAMGRTEAIAIATKRGLIPSS
jgi:hypothetical protein